MKSISISCPCGARIEFTDNAESYINQNGSPDKRGRRYLIEVRADEYLDRHQRCVDVKNQLLTRAAEKSDKKLPDNSLR